MKQKVVAIFKICSLYQLHMHISHKEMKHKKCIFLKSVDFKKKKKAGNSGSGECKSDI